MGRKSKQELQENQLLDKSEVMECLLDSFVSFEENDIDEFTLSLYQFTKLFYDNVK